MWAVRHDQDALHLQLPRGAVDAPRHGAKRRFKWAIAGTVLVAANLIAYSSAVHSPAYDEVGHLPAGLVSLESRKADLYRVNPPLIRVVAALPAWMAGISVRGITYDGPVTSRPEWRVGRELIDRQGPEVLAAWVWARWALLPFSLLAGWLCWRWIGRLSGAAAGLTALGLWGFSPNVIGNAAMITPDIGAAATGLLSAWSFALWMRSPRHGTALLAGSALGVAELSKMTWIILFPLYPLIWAVYRWRICPLRKVGPGTNTSGHDPDLSRSPPAWQLMLVLLIGWNLLNTGYLWQGTFTPLGDFPFQSETLSGSPAPAEGESAAEMTGNRFVGTWLGDVPVPLPWDYVIGLDVQKHDFEGKKWSYLFGEHKLGGWWYYYIVAMALKEPLGFWLVGGVAVWWSLRHATSTIPLADRLVLTIVPLSVFILVSSQTGFSRYLRYMLPVYPFLFIWMGRVGEMFGRPGFRVAKSLVVAGMLWGVGSSLWYFSHSLSYFNELAGGPKHGHRYLADANVSWGQDAYYLRDWIESHPDARPLTYAYISFFDLGVLGIHGRHTPSFHPDQFYSEKEGLKAGPQPGWHIVDVNYLRSHKHHYDYFQMFEPVDYVAYSMHVFHLTLEEANAARRKLGLPLLPASDSQL